MKRKIKLLKFKHNLQTKFESVKRYKIKTIYYWKAKYDIFIYTKCDNYLL